MSQRLSTENLCSNCYHERHNHTNVVCNGSLTCLCEKFVEPVLFEFAQLVEREKLERRTIGKRCEFILQRIPQSRNAGEKSFTRIYYEVWHGFKIRKGNPQVMDTDTWKRLALGDTINREKRRCKQWNEELKTYDPKVLEKQNIIYQALLELSYEGV